MFSVTCNQKHHNYYMQSVHLRWRYAHLNLANESLWRRFKDKNLFFPFQQKNLFILQIV